MTVVVMSQNELSRLDTLRRVECGDLVVDDAARLLGLTRRQVFRLLGRLRSAGAEGLVSKRRGKRSNNCLSDDLRAEALRLVRAHYPDFGPSFAAEKLAERHGLFIWGRFRLRAE